MLTMPQIICFFIMSLIFLGFGLFALISPIYNKLVCKNETTAEVVNIIAIRRSRHGRGSGASIFYHPVFRYMANDNKEIIVEHTVGSDSYPYKIGDTFTLFYNAKKPTLYYIKGLISGNWVMLLFGILTTPMSIASLIVLTKFFINLI